jgi:hypothetical protein
LDDLREQLHTGLIGSYLIEREVGRGGRPPSISSVRQRSAMKLRGPGIRIEPPY